MRTVSRRITGELLRNFALALALMSAFLLFEKLYRLIKAVPNLPLTTTGKLMLLLLPAFLPMAIPMALLVAVLLLYGRLTMDGEIIALRSLGAGPWALAAPAVAFSLLCALLGLLCSVVAAPEGRRAFRETTAAALPEAIRVDEGVITEAFPGTVLLVGEKRSERSFRNVFMFREPEGEIPAVAIAAEEGTLEFDGEQKELRFLLTNGQIHRADARTDVLLEFGSYDLRLELPSVKVGKRREEMRPAALLQWAEQTDSAKERNKLLLEVHRRFAWPVACVVFALIGVPLGARSGRSGRFGGVFASLLVMTGYYYLMILGEGMALKGTLSPGMAVWFPNVVVALAAGGLFRSRGGIR